jgi:hypothetical protein
MDNDNLGQPVFFPRGVADPSGRTGYVANAGGIDALDLLTGELLWSTDIASRPLLAFGNRLAAQRPVPDKAHALQIVVLDVAQKGRLLLTSALVVFPEWVSIPTATEESFTFKVYTEGSELVLDWQAHARYRGGAPPPPHILEQAARDAAGIARINLETGKVEMLPPRDGIAARLPKALQHVTSLPYQVGSSWRTDPWVVDQKLAALGSEESEGRQVLSLKRWDLSTGQAHEPITLAQGKGLVSSVTPDGRYLFIHQELPPGALPAEDRAWWIFSVETGQRLATLSCEPGTQEACVLGPRVYYLVEGPPHPVASGGSVLPRTLKARELASGKVLWERPLQARRVSKPPPLRP